MIELMYMKTKSSRAVQHIVVTEFISPDTINQRGRTSDAMSFLSTESNNSKLSVAYSVLYLNMS